jgi:hypothetical protein
LLSIIIVVQQIFSPARTLTVFLQSLSNKDITRKKTQFNMKLASLYAILSSISSILYRASLCTAQETAAQEPEGGESYRAQRPNVKGFGPDLTGVDPSLIVRPPPGIDYPGCFQDLVTSDRDGNGIVEQKEYLGFIQEYGKRICYESDALTLEQQAAFNSLACLCRSREGNDASCCLAGNAKLPTAGALNAIGRTEAEKLYLTTVCTVTDGTMENSKCPPYILDRETPPPVVIVPVNSVSAQAVEAPPLADNKKWAWIAAAIAGLLLLFLCCCCCVLRRKRGKVVEEEEEVIESTPGKGMAAASDEEAPHEQAAPRALASVPPIPPTVLEGEEEEESYDGEGRTRRGGHEVETDDESDGEGRRTRGSNYMPDEEEDARRRWPGGELPPQEPEDPERVVLRPIPVQEQEDDPDWDEPARELEEHKVKDDDSVQEFERYVPDSGVATDDRASNDPVTWKKDWNREKAPEPDENDNRKHRIQSGLGEGEVWDKLDDDDDASRSHAGGAGAGDVFDWVVQSALGVLDTTDQHGQLDDTSVGASTNQGSFNNH